jgi:hypothetical protein
MYKFQDKNIWGNCRTVKHCVFNTLGQESDCYVGISNYLNQKFRTSHPVIPHMIDLPPCSENMRTELGIPSDAIVLGRHGGYVTFDLYAARNGIIRFLEKESNIYFLFMNTHVFYEHPRVIHIDATTDLYTKSKFINTCDAMIHGRIDGEIFPVSIGEFCIFNKPVITCPTGDLGHILNLKDRAILYHSDDELVHILENIQTYIRRHADWNTYKEYTPENVMRIFNQIVCTKKPQYIAGVPSFLRIKSLE